MGALLIRCDIRSPTIASGPPQRIAPRSPSGDGGAGGSPRITHSEIDLRSSEHRSEMGADLRMRSGGGGVTRRGRCTTRGRRRACPGAVLRRPGRVRVGARAEPALAAPQGQARAREGTQGGEGSIHPSSRRWPQATAPPHPLPPRAPAPARRPRDSDRGRYKSARTGLRSSAQDTHRPYPPPPHAGETRSPPAGQRKTNTAAAGGAA